MNPGDIQRNKNADKTYQQQQQVSAEAAAAEAAEAAAAGAAGLPPARTSSRSGWSWHRTSFRRPAGSYSTEECDNTGVE